MALRNGGAGLKRRARRHHRADAREADMSELPASAQKVQDAARALGLEIAVRVMDAPTRTAEEAASACGVTVGQIVKSLVFTGAATGKPYLLLVSGTNRVNEKGVA